MSNSVRPHKQQPIRLPRPWDSPGKNNGVGCHFLLQCRKVKSESEVTQSCPTLSDPMDCSPPGSSIHGIFQARVLEWGAIAFSDVSCSGRQILYHWATKEAWGYQLLRFKKTIIICNLGSSLMYTFWINSFLLSPCHCNHHFVCVC